MFAKVLVAVVLRVVGKWVSDREPAVEERPAPRPPGPQGGVLLAASPVLVAAGGAAWVLVTQQLKAQRILVHSDSRRLSGKPVAGPLSAFTQAAVIERHASQMGQGRTFAEISEEWLEATRNGDTGRAEELAGPRQQIMQANFLRASLFTSVLAYGVSALTIGVGVLSAIMGSALRRPGS